MTEPLFMTLAISFIVLSALLIGSLAVFVIYRHKKWLDARLKVQQNLGVDLELATSDQLLYEMQRRQRPYLLLLPVNDAQAGCYGVSLEVHNIDAGSAAALLKISAQLAEKELRKQGVELPDTPNFEQQE